MFSPKQLLVDLAEWNQLNEQLEALRKPAEGTELTTMEIQEATGILLVRSLQNPGIFREALESIDLGKYKAIFARAPISNEGTPAQLLVRFVRT